jgi:Family of unknown function (DUF5662)
MFLKAYLKNIRYILKHKYYVFVECHKMGLTWRGIIHDWSKFSLEEFKPYALYFFGDLPSWDIVKHQSPTYPYEWTKEYWSKKFNEAWLHHKRVNKHHWDYWVDLDDDGKVKVLEMPEAYMKEMLCDWRGAGRAINGKDDTKEFYLKNRDRILLHPNTRAWIEKQLGV